MGAEHDSRAVIHSADRMHDAIGVCIVCTGEVAFLHFALQWGHVATKRTVS